MNLDSLTAHFKKGYKTSEFWLTLAASVIVLLNSAFGWDLDPESIIGLAVTVIGYVTGRAYLKGHRVRAAAGALPEEETLVVEEEPPPVA